MTCPQLRATFAAVLVLDFAACARPAVQPRAVGPVIGESTAQGPSDPTVPPPDAGGVTETSARIRGTPSPVANPVITVDTMPSTLEPSGNSDPNAPSAPVVVSPGVVTGSAPAGTGSAPVGIGSAPANPPSATTTTAAPRPTQPPTPTPPPANGPGTGTTVNPPPAAPVATPR